MEFHLILLFIISIILVIVSAFSVSIFIRIEKASTKYNNPVDFESSCNFSKSFKTSGKILSVAIFIISVLLLIITTLTIFFKY